MKILKEPNEILHKKCSKVVKFDDELKKLADDMVSTMKENNSGGLAAPQIGKSVRVIVIQWLQNNNLVGLVLINPEIIYKDDKFSCYKEECLSLDVKITKKRSRKVTVKYQDIYSNYHDITAENYLSHVLQHEIDHLDGLLITDNN